MVFVTLWTVVPSEQFMFRVRKWEGGLVHTTTTITSSLAGECKRLCGPGTMYFFPANDLSRLVKLPSVWDPANETWWVLRRAAPTAPRVILVLPDGERRRDGSPASTSRGDCDTVVVPLPADFNDMFSASAGDASTSSSDRNTEWSRNIHREWHEKCTITGKHTGSDVLQAAHIVSLGREWVTHWPAVNGEYQETWAAAGQLLKQKKFRAFLMYKAAIGMPNRMARFFRDLNVPWNGILLQPYLHKRFDLFELSLYPSGGRMLCRAWKRPRALRNPSRAHIAQGNAFMALDGTPCAAWQRTWKDADYEQLALRLLALHHGICAVKHLGILQTQSEADRKYPVEEAQAAALQAQRLIATCVKAFEAR